MVLVEDGFKLWGEKGSELLSSDIYFEGNIDDKLDKKRTVYGINDGKR